MRSESKRGDHLKNQWSMWRITCGLYANFSITLVSEIRKILAKSARTKFLHENTNTHLKLQFFELF